MPWSPLPDPDEQVPAVRPLRDVLDQVLAGLGAPSVETVVAISERWAELVGAEVAPFAKPVSVEHGRLVVLVDNPAWASHFRWSAPELVRRIAELVGEGVVQRVVTRVGQR